MFCKIPPSYFTRTPLKQPLYSILRCILLSLASMLACSIIFAVKINWVSELLMTDSYNKRWILFQFKRFILLFPLDTTSFLFKFYLFQRCVFSSLLHFWFLIFSVGSGEVYPNIAFSQIFSFWKEVKAHPISHKNTITHQTNFLSIITQDSLYFAPRVIFAHYLFLCFNNVVIITQTKVFSHFYKTGRSEKNDKLFLNHLHLHNESVSFLKDKKLIIISNAL